MISKLSLKHYFAGAASVAALATALVVTQNTIPSDSVKQVSSPSLPMNTKQPVANTESTSNLSAVPIPDIQALNAIKAQTQNDDVEMLIQEIVNQLTAEHSHEKHSLVFQVSLKDLRDDLLRSYPEQGLEIFERIISAAFPELAKDILSLIGKKDVYDEWLLNAMLDLNDMPLLEQKGTLWAKRYEIFGQETAEEIWQIERNAEEERREAVHTTLSMLNQSEHMRMEDRVNLLKSAYDENYFGTVEDLVLDSSGVLSQAIFSLDAVQEELGAMTPEERQSEINDVRRMLGFEESQIEWLAQRDQEREERWQNGYAYMEERADLTDELEGESLEAELDFLREKYFKHEASTIKKEEELLEFFRYKRPRVYGRN